MMSQAGGMDLNSLGRGSSVWPCWTRRSSTRYGRTRRRRFRRSIVAIGSILALRLGGWLWYFLQDFHRGLRKQFCQVGRSSGALSALILWGVWVAITYVMLTQIFRARADVNELIRVMGFAMLPLALGFLMFIPGLDYAIGAARPSR